MGLNLLHLNLHGLIRSHDLELGRDSDTGGQTLYVMELVQGLAARPEVDRIDLITRLINDRRVSADYSQRKECIAPGAHILRFPFGPKRYLRKELLWPYLEELADMIVNHLQEQDKLPDWIHAHYADAGYVGALVSRRLGIPLVFTAHSLGKEKLRRMLAAGIDHSQIEQSFSISRRIEAEDFTLSHCDLVVTSTSQEADQQYSRYGKLSSNLLQVIPPGVDSKRFHSLSIPSEDKKVDDLMSPFLRDSSLPPLLAISRAVQRKNIPTLVEAFGRSPVLRQRHNLILVLGCREDSRHLEKQQRDIFQQIFELVDKYNLYGKIAYPKQHKREDIPGVYRWAAYRKGLFVNPALTEPFGLTLLEAASCGLPVVTTDDGGPRDILARCQNGVSVDVTDLEAFQNTLELAGSKQSQWLSWSKNGIEGINRNFSWDAHIFNYIASTKKRITKNTFKHYPFAKISTDTVNPLGQRLLLLDLDSTLDTPDSNSLNFLRQGMNQSGIQKTNKLGVLTGSSIKTARYKFSKLILPEPSVFICSAGTEIHYQKSFDQSWKSFIAQDWDREAIKNVLIDFEEHISLQDDQHQSDYKISYLLKTYNKSILSSINKCLRDKGYKATPQLRCHYFLDVIPLRASRAEAIRFLSLRWKMPLEQMFVVASQQGDTELINGLTTTLIPLDHDVILDDFKNQQRVYFASKSKESFRGNLSHYRFFLNF